MLAILIFFISITNTLFRKCTVRCRNDDDRTATKVINDLPARI